MRIAHLLSATCALALTSCLTTGEGGPPVTSECSCQQSLPTLEEVVPSEGKPRRGGTIAIRIVSEPATLLSMLTPSPVAAQIADHDILESLVAIDPATGEPGPELALSWTEDDATGRYVFYLTHDARWHDGARVTAADVEFTFARLLDPAGGAVPRSAFLDVDTVSALDDHTVVIQLDRGRQDFVASLARVPILPAHTFGNDLIAGHQMARAPIGSGPFRFSAWRRGRAIEIERNPSWRGEQPLADRVVYRVVPDQRVAVDLFRGGDLDIVPDSDGVKCPAVAGGRVINYPLSRFEAWVYNTKTPIFSDRRVRQALGYLIDREAIRCSILDCLATPIEHPFPAATAIDPPPEPLRFDPARARQLLEDAGWVDSDDDGIRDRHGVKLSFTVLLPDSGRALRRAVTVVQHDLMRSGVEMRVGAVSYSVYTGRLRKHRFDASVISFPNRRPFDPRPLFHSAAAEAGLNFGLWSDPVADEILDAMSQERSPAVRLERAQALTERLAREHPVSFTFRPYQSVLIRESLRGVRIRDGWIDERALWWATADGAVK
jgi:peptide/nickel transport system substrate-binding protein